jgi:hypothetical protein
MNTDLKIYAINFTAMAISFTTVADFLKIVLLVISIIYTAHKLWVNITKNKSK